jgi:hypothetical protein
VHKPIPGVTAAMMEWWFSGNIEGDVVNPIDGKTYSRCARGAAPAGFRV